MEVDADFLSKFRETITPDLYVPSDLLDLEAAIKEQKKLMPGVMALDAARSSDLPIREAIAEAIIEESASLEVILYLGSVKNGIRFSDGSFLPDRGTAVSDPNDCERIASVVCDIGIDRSFQRSNDIGAQLLTAIIADQAERRRAPARGRLDERLSTLVESTIEELSDEGFNVRLLSKPEFPDVAKRQAQFVISFDEREAVAISLMFQTASGGRQQRELKTTYPNFSRELRKDQLVLCLIADGQGVKESSDKTLRDLFAAVPNCMTMRQAAAGALKASILENRSWSGDERKQRPSLAPLIQSGLRESGEIRVKELPASERASKAALSDYAERNSDLALLIVDNGSRLRWERPQEVASSEALAHRFDAKKAVDLLLHLIDFETVGSTNKDGHIRATPAPSSAIGHSFTLWATEEHASKELISNISRGSFEANPDLNLAVVILPSKLSQSEISSYRRQQFSLPVTVVLVSTDDLLNMSKMSVDPPRYFQDLVLAQADLEKVSPFVFRGATPENMFYGRESEEAGLMSILPTNSAAVLGGRRIGKTSFLRHVERQLGTAGFAAYFCDCQAVGNWAAFGEQVSRLWNIELPSEFRPHHLIDMVGNLDKGENGRIVLLLDEVDQLLKWDQENKTNEAREAFFRECRSLSQQGNVQFVFSGERTISKKLWDPHSPHWNFCKPIYLTQLDKKSTAQLLCEPLESVGLNISEKEDFEEHVWTKTSGHPVLVQYIGDELIRTVNQGARSSPTLSRDEVELITESYEYVEQYLETYWGQSTATERLVSIIVDRAKTIDFAGLNYELDGSGVTVEQRDLQFCLRMIELYGIIEREGDEIRSKLDWFSGAVNHFGGTEALIKRYAREAS